MILAAVTATEAMETIAQAITGGALVGLAVVLVSYLRG